MVIVMCSASSVMALGSDVRDILELEGADEKDEFITKEALFSDPKKVFILFFWICYHMLVFHSDGCIRRCMPVSDT